MVLVLCNRLLEHPLRSPQRPFGFSEGIELREGVIQLNALFCFVLAADLNHRVAIFLRD